MLTRMMLASLQRISYNSPPESLRLDILSGARCRNSSRLHLQNMLLNDAARFLEREIKSADSSIMYEVQVRVLMTC